MLNIWLTEINEIQDLGDNGLKLLLLLMLLLFIIIGIILSDDTIYLEDKKEYKFLEVKTDDPLRVELDLRSEKMYKRTLRLFVGKRELKKYIYGLPENIRILVCF